MSNEYFDPTNIKEEKLETFNKALLAHQKEGVSMLDGNINDFIATITLIARHNPELVDMNKDTENEISIVSYLRDKYGAKTGREAFDIISEGKVNHKVIEFWIEEGMINSPNIKKSIEVGYPELIEKFKENK